MKGLYEQNWKDAVEGANVEPSESLWENIASNLDKEKGPNYWVTLLMIAATVTIAFSFPLTIGNSAFEARPDMNPPIALSESNKNHVLLEDDSLRSDESNFEKKLLSNFTIQSNEKEAKKSYSVNSNKSVEIASNANTRVNDSGSYLIKNANSEGTGFGSFNWGNNFQQANLNSYYFIPYFMPLNNSKNRDLLASLNMGTGTSSSNGGLLNGNFSESAKVASFSDQNNALSNTLYQKESKGTTFYIGVGIELPIGKRWSLLTGLGYLVQRAEGTNNVVRDSKNGYQPQSIHDPIELGSVFLSESYHYTLTNNYISIPVSVKYPIFNRKLKFRVGAGISTDFMLNHIVNSETYNKASYKPSEVDYNSVVLSGLINFDVNYSINKQYSIALESGLRKGITPIDNNKQFYPSSFTIGVLLIYKIR